MQKNWQVTAFKHHFFLRKSGVNIKGTNKKKSKHLKKTHCHSFLGQRLPFNSREPGVFYNLPWPNPPAAWQGPGVFLGWNRGVYNGYNTKGLPVTLKRTWLRPWKYRPFAPKGKGNHLNQPSHFQVWWLLVSGRVPSSKGTWQWKNFPIFIRKYIFNTGPFSSQLC